MLPQKLRTEQRIALLDDVPAVEDSKYTDCLVQTFILPTFEQDQRDKGTPTVSFQLLVQVYVHKIYRAAAVAIILQNFIEKLAKIFQTWITNRTCLLIIIQLYYIIFNLIEK